MPIPTDKQKEFLVKLKALLSEYNVSIDFYYEGEGLSDQRVNIEEQQGRKFEVFYSLLGETSISHHDIKL